jgi:hypothetical protein
VEGNVGFLRDPDPVKQNHKFSRHCHNRSSSRMSSASSSEAKTPLSESLVPCVWPKHVIRTLDQQASQVAISNLGDTQLRIAITRLTSFGRKPR